jgi:hypothetical protein
MGARVGNAVGANLRNKNYDDIKDNKEIVTQAMNLNIQDSGLQRG